jgi:hypothetical protein
MAHCRNPWSFCCSLVSSISKWFKMKKPPD